MEATKEVEGLLDKIRPPRLEDAGLDDCALPPESIKEAFLKTATAVGSRAASIFSTSDEEEEEEGGGGGGGEGEGRSVKDPWPNVGESSDTLVGIREGVDPPPPGACSAEKGGGVSEVMGDEVAASVTDAEERADRVVVTGPEEACVDGWITRFEDRKRRRRRQRGGRERRKIPILAEACA